jgi:hypothetical protein
MGDQTVNPPPEFTLSRVHRQKELTITEHFSSDLRVNLTRDEMLVAWGLFFPEKEAKAFAQNSAKPTLGVWGLAPKKRKRRTMSWSGCNPRTFVEIIRLDLLCYENRSVEQV